MAFSMDRICVGQALRPFLCQLCADQIVDHLKGTLWKGDNPGSSVLGEKDQKSSGRRLPAKPSLGVPRLGCSQEQHVGSTVLPLLPPALLPLLSSPFFLPSALISLFMYSFHSFFPSFLCPFPFLFFLTFTLLFPHTSPNVLFHLPQMSPPPTFLHSFIISRMQIFLQILCPLVSK